MNTTPRTKLGFDDGEQKEFVKALRQPLMVQTPLQVILETFFSRLQTQAALFSELSDKVERLVLKSLDANEVIDRLRLLEASLKTMGGSKLSPFVQQDIVKRLDSLEAGGGGGGGGAAHAPDTGGSHDLLGAAAGMNSAGDLNSYLPQGKTHALEARLLRAEQKLAGVYNLSGKLLTVERMAGEMGIEVPDLEYGTSGGENIAVYSPPRNGGGQKRYPAVGSPLNHVSRSHSTTPHENGESPRPHSANRMHEMQTSIDDLHKDCSKLHHTSNNLRAEVEDLAKQLSATRNASNERFGRGEKIATELKEKFENDLTIVWKEFRRVPEVSYADYMLIKGQVETSLSQAQEHQGVVEGLRKNELPLLMGTFGDLKDQIKKAFEPRDLDNMFHQRMATMEETVKELRTDVQMNMGEAMHGGVRPDDLAAIEEAINTKASLSDLKTLSMQQSNLAQSVNNMAEWLSVRPETTDGLKNTGSAITKFKCMTCDRDMKTQSFSAGVSQSAAKGGFLPKLDAMQGSRDHVAPTGPGLNAADLRRMAEEKLAGSWSGGGVGGRNAGAAGSPPRGADFEDYSGAAGRDGSPPRAHKPSGRVAIQAPGQGPKGQAAMGPQGQRTPVFF